MDQDVVEFMLMLLSNAPFDMRGSDIEKVADLHRRATEQIKALRPAPDVPA